MHGNRFLLTALLFIGGLLIFQNKGTFEKFFQNPDPGKADTSAHSGHYRATAYTPRQLEEEIKNNPGKYAIIDVRTREEYDAGHLPDAVHADYYDSEALKKAAKDKIPVTYCAFSAMRGPYAAYQLYQAGFKDVIVLDGGISAWAEDIQGLDSEDPESKMIFNHPADIFPKRQTAEYPSGQGEAEVNIVAKKFAFFPSQIRVKHGQKVILHIMSADVTHGFSIPEFGTEEELLPNEPVTVEFIADRKGNFPFVCSVICGAGHDHASMVGSLIVE
jgi:cytochrome c oxidase subunit 2